MRVPLDELRRVTALLYDYLEARGLDGLEVPGGFYWTLPREQRQNPAAHPTEFLRGRVDDDWAELLKLQAGEHEVFGYALVWLAMVLQEIGEEHPG